MMNDSAVSSRGSQHYLHPLSRFLLIVFGVSLIGVCIWIYIVPPAREKRTQTIGSPVTIETTESDPATFCLALLTAGFVSTVIAVNGLRIIKVSSEGAETGGLPSQKEIEQTIAEAKTIEVDSAEMSGSNSGGVKSLHTRFKGIEIIRPEDVPVRILKWFDEEGVDEIDSVDDIDYAFRQPGRGNSPWFFRLKNGESYKVSFGDGGKTTPTMTTGKLNDIK